MSVDGSATSRVGLPRRGIDDLPGLPSESAHVLRGAGDEPAAGPGGDQGGESILARAAAIRFPDLRELQGRDRVEALVDHITETAIVRGELEELRLSAHVTLRAANRELANVPTAITKTKTAIDEARRRARPHAAQQADGALWLVRRCGEQIERLTHDFDAASRAYTLIAGT